MTAFAFNNTQHDESTQQQKRRAFALLLILVLHALGLYLIFRSQTFPLMQQKTVAILLQFLPAPVAPERLEKTITTSKSSAKPTTQVSATSKTRTQAIEETKPNQAEEISDPNLDPFNTLQLKPDTKTGRIQESEHLRQGAGKAWKQVESELPVKRWLSNKKELSTMERFARNLLEAAPVKDIQTKEEMRPDGSRMTRVKTPSGEFCVVGPQPGRPYDVSGPERRVMSCPVYF